MKVFIPISDEELDTWPAGDPLVPYRPGMSLLNQVARIVGLEVGGIRHAAAGRTGSLAPREVGSINSTRNRS